MSLRLNSAPKNATQRTLEDVLTIGTLFGSSTKTNHGKWIKWSDELKKNPNDIFKILKRVKSDKMMEFTRFLVNAHHGADTVFAAWDSTPAKYVDDRSLAFELLRLAGNSVKNEYRVYEIAQTFSDQLKNDIKVMTGAILSDMKAINLVPESRKGDVGFAIKLLYYYVEKEPTEMPWTWFNRGVLNSDAFKKELEDAKLRYRATSSYPGS